MGATPARVLTILLVSAVFGLMAGLIEGPAAYAAGPFTGGADSYPLYVANDHTPVAIHVATTGTPTLLDPSTQYNVKIRFCPTPSPGGGQQFGYTWNSALQAWAQERDSWNLFPVVATDSSRALSAWVIATVGKTTPFTGATTLNPWGTYYVVISLSKVGTSAGTLNGDFEAPTTLMDMTSSDPAVGGFWIHDGSATGAAAGALTEGRSTAPAATLLAQARVEPDLCDDDANGVVDDEDYGAAGSTGDFRLAVPLSQPLKILLGGAPWSPGQNVSGAIPDVDIAVGATDKVAPTAPTGLGALPLNAAVKLQWGAATDNVGVTAYAVYRWIDVSTSLQYTQPHVRVGTTTTTTFTDGGLANGQTYYYEVRALDAATNVGPRSNQPSATPDGAPPVTTSNAGAVWHAAPFTLVLSATDSDSGMTGGLAKTEYSLDGGLTWQTETTVPFTARWKRGGGSGVFAVLVRSTDAAGNVETPQTVEVKMDTSPPTSSDDAPTTPQAIDTFVHFSGFDAFSGIASFWYSVDHGPWTQGDSLTIPAPAEHTNDGLHTVRYYALDGVGNGQVGFNVCAVTIRTTLGGALRLEQDRRDLPGRLRPALLRRHLHAR